MPLEASLAAALCKAQDASALAARERVKAGLPLDEDTFFPPEQPPAQPAAPPPKSQHVQHAVGQQAARGVQVLKPRGSPAARSAAAAAK